jgi:phospholipid/cholesterol/gamma-HCH transport system substrate-binding protein
MIKYRGGSVARAGFIAVALVLLVISIGLRPESLWNWAATVRYQALFAEAGGLTTGNSVMVSGMKVGTVSAVTLDGQAVLVTFTLDSKMALGSQTTAHIRTGSLLGERMVTLASAGTEKMRPNDVIPVSRTSSPYLLTDAVGDLTTNVAGTDVGSLNQSLDVLSSTLDQLAPQLGPTFEGLTAVSAALNERDGSLRELLEYGSGVIDILSKRSEQVNTLILDANELVGVLAERRQAIVSLLANTSAVAKQLAGLVHDNEARLAPTLQRLNSVTAVLERNRDNIAKALPGLAKFESTLGETVAGGPYYTAYIPNIDLPQVLQPFVDYAFGFRRGTNAGKPPDNAGPRAEIPFPYNGIPQPGEQWPR